MRLVRKLVSGGRRGGEEEKRREGMAEEEEKERGESGQMCQHGRRTCTHAE